MDESDSPEVQELKQHEKQTMNKKYQMLIQTESYHADKLKSLLDKNVKGSKESMRSCRHVYLAHSIKLYHIKHNIQQEFAPEEVSP